MIVCTQCGHHNPDGTTFCEACDEYLEWAGEKIEEDPQEEPEPEPDPEPEPEPEPRGIVERVVDRLGGEHGPGGPTEERTARGHAGDEPRRGDEGGTSGRETAEREPADADGGGGDAGAARGDVRGEARDGAEGFGATKPKAVKRRRPPKKTTVEQRQRIRPGDVICVKCGTGNDPTSNFCKKCGMTLEDAEPAPALPWWRRLFRREPQRYEAGYRPGRGRSGGRGGMAGAREARRKALKAMGSLGRILAILAIAGVALGVSVGPWRDTATDWLAERLDSIRQLVAPTYEPVNPQGATASSSLDGHPPEDAIDLGSTTWWAEGAEGDGVGESITVTFAEPVDIAAIIVTPGVGDSEQFVQQPRPRVLHVVFDNQTTTDLAVTDSPEFQTFEVDGADGVTSVQFQVDAVWPGQSGEDLGITEIEFRTRS